MNDLLANFDQVDDDIQEDRHRRARAAFVAAPTRSPDEAARANRLADDRGLPFGVVAENLPDFEERDRLDQIEAVSRRNPVIGDFVADPRSMAMASDDIGALDALSVALRHVLPGAGTLSPDFLSEAVGAAQAGWYRGERNESLLLSGLAPDVVDPVTGQMTSDRTAETAVIAANLERKAQAAEQTTPETERQFENLARANESDSLWEALGLVARSPRAIGVITAQSLGMGAKGLLATAATGGTSRLLTAGVAGLSSGGVESGATIAEVLQESGVEPTDPYALARALRDPKLMARARDKAAKRGIAIGVFDAVTAGLAGKFIVNARRGAAAASARVAAEAALQVAGGSAGETAAQLVTGDDLRLGDILVEGVAEIPFGAVEVQANFRTARARGEVRWLNDQLGAITRSTDSTARLQALTELGAQAKLGERSPADLRAFVQRVTGDNGNVYLDAEQARVLFQSEPAVLEDIVGGAEALTEQMATGDIVIPMDQWVATVSRLPNAAEIVRHARTDAEALSAAELEGLDIDALAAELAGDTTEAAERAEPRQQVQDDVYGQLIATERYTPASAEAQAKLWGAAFSRFGQMAGQDAFAMYQRYLAGISTGRADGRTDPRSTRPDTLDATLDRLISAARDNRLPTTREAYGPTLTEFLSGDGIGAADGMEGEVRRLAENDTVRRDQILREIGGKRPQTTRAFREGYSPIVREDGIGLDYAREAAVEAGYLPEGASLDDLLNALENDFSNRPTYSPANEDIRQVDRRNEIIGLQDEIARLYGDQDISSLTNQQIADILLGGETLEQGAVPVDESTIVNPVPSDASPAEKLRVTRVLSAENQPTIDAFLADLDAELGTASKSSLKAEDRIMLKAERPSIRAEKPWHDIEHVRDTLRFKTVLDSIDQLPDIAQRLRDMGWEVVKVDTAKMESPKEWGWRFVGLDLRMPNGQLVEYYMPLQELEAVKQAQNHDLFEKWRNENLGELSADQIREYESDLTQSHSSYDAAYQAALSRTGLDESAVRASLASFSAIAESLTRSKSSLRSSAENLMTGDQSPSMRDAAVPSSSTRTRDRSGVAETIIGDSSNGNVTQSGAGNTLLNRLVGGVRRLFNQQATPAGPRGQISILPDRRMSISLFEGADRSTFLHESGHFFLEVFRDIAAQDDAPQPVRDDFAALLAWMGVESADAIGTEQHEQFARGFEQYLGEGRAPSPELRHVFAQFKAWIVSVYQALRNLNVTLTDDVRGVFDRLLATEDEIEAAQVRQGMEPVFTEAAEGGQIGLTEKQFDDYQAMLAAATEEARAEVTAKLMKAHDRARMRWYAEETAAVRAEVEAEYEALPVVRAFRILSGRQTVDGQPVPEPLQGIKLDKAALVAAHGEPYLKRLGRTYARSGGVHFDDAAMLFGFESGDALVAALANVPDTLARVDAETDARMRERHSDPMTDGTLPEIAMEAVHNNRRIRLLEHELSLLSDLAGRPKPNRREIGAAAKRLIGEKTPRQLRPNDYLVAERKAARKATQAAARGDYAEALLAKRQQVFSAAMYREARAAQTEFEKHQRYLRRFTHGDARAKLGKAGADYLEQVDALLEGLEVKAVSGRAVERRKRLADWVAQQEAEGKPIDVPQALLDETGLTNIRDLSLDGLRGVVDTIKQIQHLATLKGKLLLAGELRDAAEVDEAMASSVREHNAERRQTTGDRTNRDKLREALMQGRALQGTATDLARELDGFTDGGSVWDHIIRPIRDAMNRLRPALRGAQESLSAIYLKHYTKVEIRSFADRKSIPEVNGDEWSKRRILALALNWGNEGNREAILSQERNRLTQEQVGALLSRLDARDWAFVQDVWALVDAQWPAIAQAQRRRTGLVPEKVQPSAFTVRTADGQTLQIPGGYFPLKFEADSVKSMRDEAEDFWNSIRMGRSARAATRHGHTIERVGSGGRTVALELGLVQTHLRDVLRDLHLGDAVNYVHNTMNGHGFSEALSDTGMLEHKQALEVWLKDVASGEIAPRKRHEQAARAIRQNFTASVLAFKVVSAAIQVTGIVQSSVVLGQQATWAGVTRYVRRPKAMTRYVTEASEMMRERATTHVEAVQRVMDAEAGRVKAGHAAMLRWGYFLLGQIQRTVDVSTWLAAEAKGLELFGGDVDKARAHADDVVVRAQATQEFVDKTPLQRGTLSDSVRQSEYIRATTALASYMLAKGNIAYQRTRQTNFRKPGQALKWGGDMVTLFTVEALITTAIRGNWPDDDDEDGILDDLSMLAAEETFFGVVGGIPGFGSVSGSLRGYGSGGIVASFAEAARNAWDQAQQGELDKAAVKSVITVAGYGTGIPAGQIKKTIDAIAAERNGEDVSAVHYLTGPPRD